MTERKLMERVDMITTILYVIYVPSLVGSFILSMNIHTKIIGFALMFLPFILNFIWYPTQSYCENYSGYGDPDKEIKSTGNGTWIFKLLMRERKNLNQNSSDTDESTW